ELGRVGGGLSAAVDGDLEPVATGVDEELRDPAALVEVEEHALAGGPEGEDAVHAVRGEEVDVRADGFLVGRRAAPGQGSQRGGDRSVQHDASLESGVVANLRVERD